MFKIRLVAFLCLALAACAPRPETVFLPQAAQIGTVEPLFYSTTRNPEPAGKYGTRRIYTPHYGLLNVTIPPDHTPGKFEINTGVPDPNHDFALASETRLDTAPDFRGQLSRELRKRPRGQREVVLFVHGFNVNFAEGAFRLAQLMDDFDISGVPLLFSWSSAGRVLGYEHDRDSALFARDALEKTIKEVRAAGAESILLVAHSMGAFLAVETLRQMAIENPSLPRRTVNAVVLISPDIDVDVFHSQAWRMGKLPQPFVIFVSNKDRALQLSAMISGAQNQLGNISSISQVSDLPVTVFNVTKFATNRDFNHFTIGTSPALIRMFKNVGAVNGYIEHDRSGQTGLLPGTVLAVQKATEILLEPLSLTAE